MRIFDHINTSKKRSEDLYINRLLQTPRPTKVVARWLLAFIIIFFIGLFLPWQQHIKSRGEVIAINPEDRPQIVNSQISGKIERWFVHEGDFVMKGDTLLQLSEVKDAYLDPNLLERLAEQIDAKQQSIVALEDKVTAMDSVLAALRKNKELSLSKAINKIQQTKAKILADSADYVAAIATDSLAKDKLERTTSLYEDGLKSLNDWQAQKVKVESTSAKRTASYNKLLVSRAEYQNARLQYNSVAAEYDQKIAKTTSDQNDTISKLNSSKSDVSKMINKRASTVKRAENYFLKAPRSGYVTHALRNGIGEIIKEGEALLTIVPNNVHKAVALYFRPADMPLINKGTKVRLQFDGWPAIQFSGWPSLSYGTFSGTITVIDVRDMNGSFRVLAVPDNEEEKWPEPLYIGTGVISWAMLEEVPVWYEIWRQLNAFPASLPKNAIPYQSGKESTSDKNKSSKK